MIYEKSFPFQHAPQRSLWIKLWKHFLLRVPLFLVSIYNANELFSLMRPYCSHIWKVEAWLKVNNLIDRDFQFRSIVLMVLIQTFERKVSTLEIVSKQARCVWHHMRLMWWRLPQVFSGFQHQLYQFTGNLHALREKSSLWTLLFTLQLICYLSNWVSRL